VKTECEKHMAIGLLVVRIFSTLVRDAVNKICQHKEKIVKLCCIVMSNLYKLYLWYA